MAISPALSALDGATVAAAPAIIRELHEILAWVVIIGNGVAGLWALAADRWGEVRHRFLWWLTWAAQGSIFVQVGAGIWLRDGIDNPHLQMHMFYGFVALFTIVLVYAYRSQLAMHRYLLYGFGGLFLMGLGIRAMYLNPT